METLTSRVLAKNIIAGDLFSFEGSIFIAAQIADRGNSVTIFTDCGEEFFFLNYASLSVLR